MAVPEQPTNVSLSKPTGTLSESSLSIKAQLDEIRKKQLVPESELPRNQFNSDLLLAATRRYAHVLKNLGKETFYHALIKRDPQLNDETITITVDNEVQIAYITPILSEFVDYLKEDLKSGIRGFPQKIGARYSKILATISFSIGLIFVLLFFRSSS